MTHEIMRIMTHVCVFVFVMCVCVCVCVCVCAFICAASAIGCSLFCHSLLSSSDFAFGYPELCHMLTVRSFVACGLGSFWGSR